MSSRRSDVLDGDICLKEEGGFNTVQQMRDEQIQKNPKKENQKIAAITLSTG
jgi:hypothetical protein